MKKVLSVALASAMVLGMGANAFAITYCGQIVNVEEWGLKKLAYPIQKKTTGFYFLIEFTGMGPIVETLETQYRRDERVIRFLTFKQDKYAVEYAEKRRAKLANKSQEE